MTSPAEPGENSEGTERRRRRFGLLRTIARHFQRTIAAGILVMLPIGITALVLKFVFDLLTSILQPVTDLLPGPDINGTGLIALLVVIYLVGLVAAFVLGRRLIGFAHRVMEVIPFVKGIYSTTRSAVQLLGSNLEANESDKYTAVVLIEFPRQGIHSIGLVTSRMDNPDGGEFLSVYVPTTPIPSSGFLVIVPDTEVITTDISVEDAMSVVVSGGILTRRVFERSMFDETEADGNVAYREYKNQASRSGSTGGLKTMDVTPERVLVVIPHPNDSEFWCAGSIAKWITEGAAVRYVICTDGSKGTADPVVSQEELAATREREQADSARELGVKELISLGLPDGGLEDVDDFRRELVRQIRQVRPDIVVCPEPYRKNLAWHRDNRIAGQVTLDAVFPCARDHLHFEELWRDEGLEPHKTGTVLFWGTETPNTFVDISSTLATKSRAVKANKSRLADKSEEEVDSFIQKQGQEGAGDSGATYGEAFRMITFRT